MIVARISSPTTVRTATMPLERGVVERFAVVSRPVGIAAGNG